MQDIYSSDIDTQQKPFYKKTGFWVYVLLVLFIVSSFFCVRFYISYKKTWRAYQVEKNNLDKYNVIETSNNELIKGYQKRIDSFSTVVISIRKDLSEYETASKTKINDKYENLFHEADNANGLDSNIKLAKKLLSINDRLRLE